MYSDISPIWDDKLKKELGWNKDKNDGVFFMSFNNEFLDLFHKIIICEYYNSFNYKFHTFISKP